MNEMTELALFSKIAQALQVDPEECLAASSLKRQGFEKTLEIAFQAVLKKAMNQQKRSSFQRLSPEQQLILLGLYLGRWSYLKLSRILEKNPEVVEALAWSARIQLSQKIYPSAPTMPGCPAYDFQKPWTQRFLDEEMHSSQLFSLKNHLLSCKSCSQALQRSRSLYYQVAEELSQYNLLENTSSSLKRILEQSPYSPFLAQMTFQKSLQIFLNRWEIKYPLGIFFAWGCIRWVIR